MQSGNGAKDKPGRTDEMNNSDSKLPNVKAAKDAPREKSVGDALRAVYREAIDEDVPDAMLDLLNKLG